MKLKQNENMDDGEASTSKPKFHGQQFMVQNLIQEFLRNMEQRKPILRISLIKYEEYSTMESSEFSDSQTESSDYSESIKKKKMILVPQILLIILSLTNLPLLLMNMIFQIQLILIPLLALPHMETLVSDS